MRDTLKLPVKRFAPVHTAWFISLLGVSIGLVAGRVVHACTGTASVEAERRGAWESQGGRMPEGVGQTFPAMATGAGRPSTRPLETGRCRRS